MEHPRPAKQVLITGALGNIGLHAVRRAVDLGLQVRCLDRPTRVGQRLARRLPSGVEMAWGDVRDEECVRRAVEGRDRVLHAAAIIPPRSDTDPELARSVNVGGTLNILRAMQNAIPRPGLIYVSSIAVFGRTQHLEPPRTTDDPIEATDHYTAHKIECEAAVRSSGLTWAILRMGACPPVETLQSASGGRINPMMFDVPLTDRIEFVHPADAGVAVANALVCDEVWARTLLIGGGERCRVHQGDLIRAALEAAGIGMLPEEAFTTTPFHTDWLDTTESQALLQYQTRGMEDYIRDIVASLGFRRPFIRLLRPLIRRAMLRASAHLGPQSALHGTSARV